MKKPLLVAAVSVVAFTLFSRVALAAPSSPEPLKGDITVGAFTYEAPAKDFRPNVGDNIPSAPTIEASLREAMIAKLSARGVRLGDERKTLQGKVQVFKAMTNDGAPTDCFLAVEYQVRVGANATSTFRKESSARSFDTQAAREEVMERNLAALLSDQAFLAAIK